MPCAVAQGSDPALSGRASPRNSRSPERDQLTPSSSPPLAGFSPCQYSARRSPPSHCSPQPAAAGLLSASAKRNSSWRSSPGKGAASTLPGKHNRVSFSTQESNLKQTTRSLQGTAQTGTAAAGAIIERSGHSSATLYNTDR